MLICSAKLPSPSVLGFPLRLLLHPSSAYVCSDDCSLSGGNQCHFITRSWLIQASSPQYAFVGPQAIDPDDTAQSTEHRVYALFGREGKWIQRARKVHRCPYLSTGSVHPFFLASPCDCCRDIDARLLTAHQFRMP